MSAVDPERVAAIIREVAQTEIVPRFRHLRDGEIREKTPGQLVTAADTAAEQALTRRLLALDPGSVALGEEATDQNPGLFGLLEAAAPVWVIDPVDGTINFAHGKPGFAVIIARVIGGVTRAGWIYDPLGDIGVMAFEGGGAWCGGARVRLAADTPAETMVGSAYGNAGATAALLAQSGRIGGVVNRMSSGMEYLALASGESQFALSSRSLPWDHAAGVLMAAEAGGVAGFVDGSTYDPRILDRGVLAAASGVGWDTIRHLVAGSATGG